MFHRRAQAAMEFLMTYGWALLIVIIAIAALALFGALSPNRFLPEKCTLAAGWHCDDFAITQLNDKTEIKLLISNFKGVGLQNVLLTVSSTQCSGNALHNSMEESKQYEFIILCDPLESGTTVRADLLLTFQTNEGFEHVAEGKLTVRVP